MTSDDTTPTVEEALERLAGRRATAIEIAAHSVVVKETVGQNRHTRRNNLRLARAEARRRAPSPPSEELREMSSDEVAMLLGMFKPKAAP